MELNNLYNMDCMDGMREFPDGYFDLAIVDPPYGGGGSVPMKHSATETAGEDSGKGSTSTISAQRIETTRGGVASTDTSIKMSRTGGTWDAKYSQGGVFENEIYVHRSSNPGGNRRDYTGECDIRHWDYAPPKEYFTELQRVSKNQIIWGGNYFDLPPTRCFIVWRKTNIPLKGFTMAPVEYAWTSFNKNAAMFEYTSAGTLKEPRFHPTQKPVQLYQWTLDTFAEQGMRILDTHAGSASSLVACERMGFEYIGFELDKTYFRLASERLEAERSKPTLF